MKSFQSFVTALFAFALLFWATLGCRQIQKLRSSSENTNTEPTPFVDLEPAEETPPAVTAKSGLNERSNLYIGECYNRYSNRVLESYGRYSSWIRDMKTGPTGSESIIYGLYDVNGDGTDCAKAIDQAAEMEPDMPETEEIAERYSEALAEVITAIRSVYNYYDQEDYKDDGFRKGKDAHSGLVAAFEKFKAVNTEFQAEIDNIENEVARQRLDEFRGDPAKKFAFAVVDFSIRAKKLSGYVQRTEYAKMSADELQTMVDEVDSGIAAMKENAASDAFASLYFSAADDFLKASKELMRRVRDRKPFNDFERRQLGTAGGWMVDGSPDKVINKYNDLVQRRSSLRL